MKQRIIQIIMLLFAVVGWATAQSTPAPDIKITVPAGKVVQLVPIGWDASISHTSPLLIHPDGSAEGSFDEYSSAHVFTLDNTKGTADAIFKLTKENASVTPSWPTTLTMEVKGPAKAFEVEDANGPIASRLSALYFINNDEALTTFDLSDVAAKCSKLTTVTLPDAKLSKIYSQPTRITSINATTQTPQITAVSVQGEGTENSVSIPNVLKKSGLLSKNVSDGFVVSVASPYGTTLYRDKEATDYQKVIFYDKDGNLATGEITLKVKFAEGAPYYGTTLVLPIDLKEPAFNWTVNATECTAKLHRDGTELAADAKVKKGQKLQLVVQLTHTGDQFSTIEAEGLTGTYTKLSTPLGDTFEFTVDGDKAPKITVVYTHVDPPAPADPPKALITLAKSEGGNVQVKQHNGNDAVGHSFTADEKPFTLKVTPDLGYVVEKVYFNNEEIELEAKNEAKLKVVATDEVKINPIVVMFKRAATFELVYDNALFDNPKFQVEVGGTYTDIAKSKTYDVGLHINIKAKPKADAKVIVDQILVNGVKYEAGMTKTVLGVNRIEVTTRSTSVTGIDVIGAGALTYGTDYAIYGGSSNTKIKNLSSVSFAQGDMMKLSFVSNKLQEKKFNVKAVYFNGNQVQPETNGVDYISTFVGGRNTVTIYLESTVATISVNSNEVLKDGVVTLTVGTKPVAITELSGKEFLVGQELTIKFDKTEMDAQYWKESAVYVNETKLSHVINDEYTFKTNLVAGRNVISIHSTSTKATISMNSNAAFGTEEAVTYLVGGKKVKVTDFATKEFLAGETLIIKFNKSKMDGLKVAETSVYVNETRFEPTATTDPNIVQISTTLVAGKNVISILTISTVAKVSMNTDVAFKDGAVTYTIDNKDVTADQFATYETIAGKELVITFHKKLMDAQKLKETSVYVNETKIEGKETDDKITFTYKLLAGRNVISIHTTSTAATISVNSDVELNKDVVTIKVNNNKVTDFTKEFLVNDALEIVIDKSKLYEQKLKLTSVYLNSTLLTPVFDEGDQKYRCTEKLKAGENVVTIHTMDARAIVNLMPTDTKAGTVKYYYDKDVSKEAKSGDEKEADEILYVKPTIAKTSEYKYITVTKNNEVIDDPNKDGIYEIPLVSGNNNIFVSFSKEKPGSLKVILKGAKNEISDVWVHEKEGTDADYMMNKTDSTFTNLPTKNAVNISFKAPAPTELSKKVSVVLNAKAYTPTWNETLKRYEIKEDIYLLSRSRSVLRIDVKTLSTITLEKPNVTNFVYNATPQAPTFTTKVGEKEVYFDDFKLEYQVKDKTQTISKPTNVGQYKMIITRPADNEYVAFNETISFEITKAPLIVVRMPSISINWTNEDKVREDDTTPWEGDFVIGDDGKVGFKTPSGYQEVDGEFTFYGSDKFKEGTMTKDWVGLKFEVDADDPHEDNTSWDKTTELSAFYTVGNPVKKENQTKPQLTISKARDSKPFIGKRADGLVLIDPQNGNNVKVQHAGITSFELSIDEEVIPGVEYEFQSVSETGHHTEIGKYSGTPIKYPITKDETIRLKVTDKRSTLALEEAVTDQTFTYDGEPKVFDHTKLKLDATTNPFDLQSHWTVTYSQNGVNIPEPIEAGTYTVTMVRAADDDYREFTTTGKLIINKMKLKDLYILSPEATPIAEGAPLSTSQLEGAAEIVGKYEWRDSDIVPSNEGSGGDRQDVQFIPFDTKNYDSPYNAGDAFLTFLPKQDVIRWTAELGTITVTDANGANVQNGTAITKGATYRIVASPAYPGKVQFSSMTINGNSHGSSTTVKADGENSIVIHAVFTLIQPQTPDPVYIYDNHIVYMPNYVRGAIVSKTGPHEVKHNGSFEFTVTTLPADADKVVVRVDGGVLKKENGTYTISNITSQRTVAIDVPNATEIKLDVQDHYHSAKGNTTATVQVVNRTANDGKYYYNDDIQVVAFLGSGITLKGWSDAMTNTNKIRQINLRNPEYTLKLRLGGELVGVEAIEGVKVYGGEGCIIVKGAADAQITVTTFAGKTLAVREVSGDAEIAVPAGSYIVTWQDGSLVQRDKVVVK